MLSNGFWFDHLGFLSAKLKYIVTSRVELQDNAKERSPELRETIQNGNSNPQKRMKSIENGKYPGKYKSLYKVLSFPLNLFTNHLAVYSDKCNIVLGSL